MTVSRAMDLVALCILVALASGSVVYFYMLRSAVGKAMRNEVAKKYGTRQMRKYLGMPHPDVPTGIADISPRFCKIFEQSEYAEQDGYDEVCGIGYGKALEVLIKDYAISMTPANADRIRKASLAECIAKHVANESIRDSTDLARWLRNDETHYERAFTQHGIADLKGLIAISILLIQQEQVQRKMGTKLQAMRENMSRDRATQK